MDTLFLQIFNTAVTAGWLVLAVILARLLLRNAPAWIKCALWAIVALRLLWPFSFESVLSLLPSTEVIHQSQLYVPAPQVNTGIPSLNTAINPVFTETFYTEPANSANRLQTVLWVAGWVWVVGMVAMAAYALVSYLRIRRQVRFSVPEGKGIYLCDEISAPFILGITKPKIYLPADLPREKWDSILSHEHAHLIRRDHWWKPLGFLLLTVFWFHPLLWLAYILLCRDVELACDERVIKGLSAEEKQAYSTALLECSIPRKWITACPLAFGETGVKQRIWAVLHYKKPTLWILIAALIVCSVLAVGFLTDPKDEPVTREDVAGKTYVYGGEGFGSSFKILIGEYGSFQYYEGLLSSHIGEGKWEIKDGKLYLYDEGLSHTRTYVFSVQGDCLAFCAAESDEFTYVPVPDGAIFYANQPLAPEEPLQQNLMWVQVVRFENNILYAVDGDDNCWKILTRGDVDAEDFFFNACWVSFLGEPTQIDEQISDTMVAQYQITAEKCWWRLDAPEGVDEKRLVYIYDYCYYDIDMDGVTEICVLSAGRTSGASTFIFSVWENGVCVLEKWIYEDEHSYSTAFVLRENRLSAVNTVGKFFDYIYADGKIRVITEGWIQ